MPLPADMSLCLFGDSHLACLKYALDEDRVMLDGLHVEFWGADGPRFRDLHMVEGRLQPVTGEARERVAMVNGQGRESLGPQDFDAHLFCGCRLRAHDYLPPMLMRQKDEAGFLTAAVQRLVLRRWLEGTRAYRTAVAFAAEGARVFFAPAPFLNDQVVSDEEAARSIPEGATAQQRGALWDGIGAAMAEDRVELIRQPEDTVTRGALSRIEFAAGDGSMGRDTVHKNGAFGALILQEVLDRLPEARLPALQAAGA